MTFKSDVLLMEPGGGPEPSNPSPRLAQYVRACSEPKSKFGSTSPKNIGTIDPTDNISNSDYSGNNKPQSSVNIKTLKKQQISTVLTTLVLNFLLIWKHS